MGFLSLEHSKAAYRTDFAFYGMAIVSLAAFLWVFSPHAQRLVIAFYVLVGLGSWTLIEYALHRLVLHGVPPFRHWHADHHQRPTALICAPTVLSATLMVMLVFLPTLVLSTLWFACALTLGVLTGYLAYAVTHHATHHWRADNAWLKQRKRWHALHHHGVGLPGCYGVTSTFWDWIFGSTGQTQRRSVTKACIGN